MHKKPHSPHLNTDPPRASLLLMTGIEFAEYLDRKGRTKEGARLFNEALARVAATEPEVPASEEPRQRQPCENLGVRKLNFICLTSK